MNKALLIIIPVSLVLILVLTWLFIPARLTIEVSQVDSYVTIKEVQQPTPYESKFRWGKHRIIIGAPGYEQEEHVIKATPGIKKTYQFSLIIPSDQAGEVLDEIQTKNLWTEELPRTNDRYEIIYSPHDKKFTISIFAILNRPDQIESYQQQLTAYGNEALAWIRSQGGDPATLQIEWLPEKPSDLK